MTQLSETEEYTVHKSGIMGARLEIAGPDISMYLVISGAVFPETLVQANKGEIVMKLSADTLLVTLPFNGYMLLKEHPLVRKIGPVTVDIARFNKAIAMLTRNAENV